MSEVRNREGAGERMLVAMSGGVDSSVAAACAREAGFEVVGVTMHLSGESSRCCSLEDVDDARRVAESLGIRFFVANYGEAFREAVIEPFAEAYLAGRTPIPCVACNTEFKFDRLLARAEVLGAKRVATGHYARVARDPESGRQRLLRARDSKKDQSYYLFQLDQAKLERAWFPLGGLTKPEVRERARALGLVTAEKPESFEICFVPDGDYAKVVEGLRPEARDRAGDIVDTKGDVLGRHAGIHRFTVGQRRGLGLSSAESLYVLSLDALRRRVVVGPESALGSREMRVEGVSWVSGETPSEPIRAAVKVRARHEAAVATLKPRAGGEVRVHFDAAVRAIAPGQAAVFYGGAEGDEVLGGGWSAGAAA